MKNISMMIKPVSGLCNMSCAYCFYCDEAQKREKSCYGQMSEETLKNVIRKTMLPADGVVSYTWQGGEPFSIRRWMASPGSCFKEPRSPKWVTMA